MMQSNKNKLTAAILAGSVFLSSNQSIKPLLRNPGVSDDSAAYIGTLETPKVGAPTEAKFTVKNNKKMLPIVVSTSKPAIIIDKDDVNHILVATIEPVSNSTSEITVNTASSIVADLKKHQKILNGATQFLLKDIDYYGKYNNANAMLVVGYEKKQTQIPIQLHGSASIQNFETGEQTLIYFIDVKNTDNANDLSATFRFVYRRINQRMQIGQRLEGGFSFSLLLDQVIHINEEDNKNI